MVWVDKGKKIMMMRPVISLIKHIKAMFSKTENGREMCYPVDQWESQRPDSEDYISAGVSKIAEKFGAGTQPLSPAFTNNAIPERLPGNLARWREGMLEVTCTLTNGPRASYLINGKQPVKSTLIGNQPHFYFYVQTPD